MVARAAAASPPLVPSGTLRAVPAECRHHPARYWPHPGGVLLTASPTLQICRGLSCWWCRRKDAGAGRPQAADLRALSCSDALCPPLRKRPIMHA